MKNVQVQLLDCTEPAAIKLERVNFFNRQLLTVDDMNTERDYFLQKLRRHNRFLHGWGVVCGLPVTASPVAGSAWRVQIGSGYALGPYGDEIFVGEVVYFDLAACLTGGATNPCEPGLVTPGTAGSSTTAYLAIKYAECLARPVQVGPSNCGCDGDPCQYSRIRDSFQIQCLPKLPPQPPPPVTLCQVVRGGALAPCPPCPTDPWVVLAKINLPSSTTMNITNSSIDNVSVRRVLLSTAVLQDQLVRCCCGPGSSSSSSSSSSIGQFNQPGALNVGQRATRVAGADARTQIAVTVMNGMARAVENVVVIVNLSPTLPADEYTLTPAVGWRTATLRKLQSDPFPLGAGKAHTLSFEIAPATRDLAIKLGPVTITSAASAATSTRGVSGLASPIRATIG